MTTRRDEPLLVPIVALALAGIALLNWIAPFAATEPVQIAGKVLLGAAAALGAVVLLRQEPAWALSLGVAAMIFSSHWDLLGPPVAIDRVLIAIGLIALIGRAYSVRDVLGRELSGIHWLLALAALYAICSAAFAGTIGDRTAIFALLDRYGFVPFVLFAVAPAAFATERQRRILLGVLTLTGAYLAYVSILARLGPRSLVWPSYVVDPSIGIHANRARGPFIEAGANGLALFECGIAAALFAAQAFDRRVRLAAGAVAIACALSVEFTLTRSVWVGSAIALAVAFLATPRTRRYIVPGAAIVLIVVFGALAIVPGLRQDAQSRENDNRPVWDRRNANSAALRMIAARPLAGFGWFRFEANSGDYMRLNGQNPLTRDDLEEHNVFLSNAVELGLIGAAIWALALVCAIGGAILRRGPPELLAWKVGLAAIAVQWAVVANFVPLGYAFPNALLWLWAGVVAARPAEALERIPVQTPTVRRLTPAAPPV